MSIVQVDAKINRLLLDSNFEGYKLSLEPIPVISQQLACVVYQLPPSDTQWSYQHARIYAQENNLISDKYAADKTSRLNSYFWAKTDSHIKLCVTSFDLKTRKFDSTIVVAEISVSNFDKADRYNPKVSFANAEYAVISDGFGNLHICYTGERKLMKQWEIIHRELSVLSDDDSFVLLDATVQGRGTVFDCVLQYVKDRSAVLGDADRESTYLANILLVQFKKTGDKYEFTSALHLQTSGNVEFCGLLDEGRQIVALTSKELTIVDENGMEIGGNLEEINGKKVTSKLYSWGQSAEDVCAMFTVQEGIHKNDVKFELSSDHIKLYVNELMLLDGHLGGDVDVEASTWTIVDNRLELTLCKCEHQKGHMWTEAVVGDTRGEYEADPELVRQVAQTLRHMTHEEGDPRPQNSAPAFNSQQLEECDQANDALQVYWIDCQQKIVTHQADFSGRQLLFVNNSGHHEMCIRHDVDGILWTVGGEHTLKHETTFNAFGYVQAGKERRKYSACASAYKYVCIAEMNKHVFVYWQPEPIETDLRHRSSGRQVSHIAKTQLLNLPDHNAMIDGIATYNSAILVLTSDGNIHAGIFPTAETDALNWNL